MSKSSVDKLKELARELTDTAEPYIRKAVDAMEPIVREARDKAEPVIREAREKAEPVIRDTVEKAGTMSREAVNAAMRSSGTQEIYIQYGDHEVRTEDLAQKVREDYGSGGGKLSDIHDLQIYVKPEDYAVYYVVNREQTGKVVF